MESRRSLSVGGRRMPSVFPVTCHTDHVGPGSTFVAIAGYKKNGTDFIVQAVERGATTVVVADGVVLPKKIKQLLLEKNITLSRVADTRLALAQLSAQELGNPASILKIFGITVTNGKTTSSFLLHHILTSARHKTALLSTVHNKINDDLFATQLTTQQPDYLHAFFALCVERGVTHVVMEVAAQALTLHRVHGIAFDAVIFTNFGMEHAEFYTTEDDYFAAKCLLLSQRKKGALVIINGDDPRVARLKDSYENVKTFGFTLGADYVLHENVAQTDGIACDLTYNNNVITLQCPALIGKFNMYNAAGVALGAQACGVSTAQLTAALLTFSGVPGRLEKCVLANGATCFIDYAHNPSSYASVLPVLRAQTDHLIVVFGAGGSRDHARRPIMGRLAAQYADQVVLTNDNPRNEDPQSIIDNIISGISNELQKKVVVELDREQAIHHAYKLARSGSVIAVFGKGPDEYQEIGDTKFFFSDKQVVKSLE